MEVELLQLGEVLDWELAVEQLVRPVHTVIIVSFIDISINKDDIDRM